MKMMTLEEKSVPAKWLLFYRWHFLESKLRFPGLTQKDCCDRNNSSRGKKISFAFNSEGTVGKMGVVVVEVKTLQSCIESC